MGDPVQDLLDALRKAHAKATEVREFQSDITAGDPRTAAIVLTTIEEAILRTQVLVDPTLITGGGS